jgi:hypothetical protein
MPSTYQSALRDMMPGSSALISNQAQGQSVEPFERSYNPFNPAFRESVRGVLNDVTGASNVAGNDGYLRSKVVNLGVDAMDATAVGNATGFGDTADALSKGNYGGAAINGIATLAGMIPIAGKPIANKIKSALRTMPEFGPVIQTARAGERFEIPVMDSVNPLGYSDNPLMGAVDQSQRPPTISQGTFKRRVSEYNTDPVIRRREDARLLGGVATSPEDLYMQTATYEQMLGRPLIVLPADKTIYGNVSRVAGVDIDPYMVQGGPGHLDKHGNWVSMGSAARGKQLHANKVMDKTGEQPMYVYTAMGNPGSNFAESASAVALRYIESGGGLTDNGVSLLNSKMGAMLDKGDTVGIATDWPGYESPQQVMEWLKNDTPKGPSAGNKRKAFISALDSKQLQDNGAPIMNDVYSIINEKELRDYPAGFSGHRAMLSEYTDHRNLMPDNTNDSYDTKIPGQHGLAITDPMVPWNVMFPDPAKARAKKQGPYRSFQTSGSAKDYQMANDEWFEGIQNYLRSLKE